MFNGGCYFVISKKHFLSYIVLCVLSMCLLVGCGNVKNGSSGDISGKVTGSGSTALLPLLKVAQEEFYKKHDNVTINLSAGGSFTGQNQVVSGSADIGASDVQLQDSLKDSGLKEYIIVGIPYVFIVNKNVNVDDLTQEQYKKIFTGKITNWKEVGGNDQLITVFSRPLSSGGRATVIELVLQKEQITDDAIVQDSNGAVRSGVETTPGAIGYVDASYVDESVKVLCIDSVEYSIENVANKKYNVYSLGRIFTRGEPQGATKAFIDYVMSKEFQDEYAQKNGFIPLEMLTLKE